MQRHKCCYGYKHWTLEEHPRCFYVGKGVLGRVESRGSRNHKWHAIVKRFGIRVEICVGQLDNDAACQWEIENIAAEKTFSANHDHDVNDIGCNFTIGGDGVTGRQQAVAERMMRSERMKQRFADEPNARLVISRVMVQRWADPKFRDKWNRRREQRMAVRANARNKIRTTHEKFIRAEIALLSMLYASGASLRTIAAKCSISVNRVRARLRAGGVTMRKCGGTQHGTCDNVS